MVLRKRSFAQIVLDKTVSTPHSAKSGASSAPFYVGRAQNLEATQTRADRFNKGEARNALARAVFFDRQRGKWATVASKTSPTVPAGCRRTHGQ